MLRRGPAMIDTLLWLLAHGGSFWRGCLVAFVLAAVALAALRPRLAARRSARAARRQLGPPRDLQATAVGGVHVTLTGRLEVAGGDRLALRVGDAAVLLDGPLEVLAGAREVWPGRRGDTAVSRSLTAGDRARVSGVLGAEASDDAASYRSPAKRWTLGGPLAAACEGAPRVSGPAAPVLLASALAGGLGFCAVFGLGGEVAMTVGARAMTRFRVGELGPPPAAIAIAAATPFRRADALSAVVLALDARRDPDPGALAERARLHEQRGDRAELASLWIDHGDLEHGARLAEEADRSALAAHGWYAAGAFERAADAWERAGETRDEAELRFGVGVLLFANRPDRAAQAARRLAGALRAHPAENDRLRRWYASRAWTATCLADALDARRGIAAAWQAIHTALPDALPPACAVLRVDLFEGAERIEAIRDLPPLSTTSWDAPRAWLDVLATEADPDDLQRRPRMRSSREVDPPEAAFVEELGASTRALIVPNEGVAALALPGVADHLAEALAPRGDRAPDVWAHASASAALFALLAGDGPRAQLLAHRLQREVATLPQAAGPRCTTAAVWHAVEVQGLVGLVTDDPTLDDPSTQQASAVLLPLASFRRDGDARRVLDNLAERPAPDEDEMAAWTLAGQGDGTGLARWLSRPVAQPGMFLRFGAPLLRTGRDAVVRWLRWGYRPPTGFRPTDDVVHLATLATAAEAFGLPALAASLHERARRFRAAILRRETAIPLAVLERL
jgi:hypothetical protein